MEIERSRIVSYRLPIATLMGSALVVRHGGLPPFLSIGVHPAGFMASVLTSINVLHGQGDAPPQAHWFVQQLPLR